MVVRGYTTESFPLPTIVEWNSLVTELVEDIEKNAKNDSRPVAFRGAVDDLEGGNCGYCGDEMIRQSMGYTPKFMIGIVFCYRSVHDDQQHPMEYWAEIWPKATSGKSYFLFLQNTTIFR